VPAFDLAILESQVEELIRTCRQLREENASLRARQEILVAERAELIDKTELARGRVESMISRLKSMEEGI
jgi:cell division protein ZapB